MTHEKQRLTRRELRQFGLMMGVMVGLMFGVVLPWLWSAGNWWLWPWPIVGLLWLTALLVPMALRPVYRGWMWIAEILAWINTRLILGLTFYFIIFPVGVVMRLVAKDPMQRRFDPAVESYRIESRVRDADHLQRPF